MSSNFYLSAGIAILLVMFNVYFTNVITGYDKRPEYPEYPYTCLGNSHTDTECEAKYDSKKANYDAVKNVRETLEYRKHIGLLIMGILNLVLAMVIKNPLVNTALGLSGIITLIYATGLYWTKYNDKARLGIVTVGLVVIIYMSMRSNLLGWNSDK